MKIPNTSHKRPRHPAVIDTLGGGSSAPPHTPGVAAGPRRTPRRRGTVIAIGLAVAAFLAVIVWAAQRPSTSHAPVPALTALPPSTAVSTTAPDECHADPGDQTSGEAVIRAFEFAYYVTRSAEQARKLATPTSSVQPAAALQRVIDALPPGTGYCLHLAPIGGEAYVAVLTEKRPGQLPQQWTQTITTARIQGRWYVDVFK